MDIHKVIILGIVVLFVGVNISISTGDVSISSSSITLFVGGGGFGNYTFIQDAIDDASDGDTVFVYDDSSPYYENLIINKTINLVGEDKNTTIIDGGSNGDVIHILSEWVNITQFTIITCEETTIDFASIVVYSKYNHISNNIFTHKSSLNYTNENAIHITHGNDNNIISDNIISGSSYSLYIESSNNQIVNNQISEFGCYAIWVITHSENYESYEKMCHNNTISNNIIYESKNGRYYKTGCGIWLRRSRNNIIYNNTITGKAKGMILELSSNENLISGNNVSNNLRYGIGIGDSSCNNISRNNLLNNDRGIWLFYRPNLDNIIYHNNFINNNDSAKAQDCYNIKWIGNYWSDWIGLRFNLLKFLPYRIPGTLLRNLDWNPAMEPYDLE